MKLHMFLHDVLAATFHAGPNQLQTRAQVRWTETMQRVSAAWDETPDLVKLRHWLDACLPENGSLEPFQERAAALQLERGGPGIIHGPVDTLWGNTDAEYPGAVRFARDDEPAPKKNGGSYARMSEATIGRRLHEAWEIASRSAKGSERKYRQRRSSLSGARGKLGLTLGDDGSWLGAEGTALNTWIAKREDNPKLVGEAGVESICQRTLALLGIPAARTLARVFAGEQAVLSERSDRYVETASGTVRPRHQEEFCQACGWPGLLKYDEFGDSGPHWEDAYAIVARHAADPESEHAKLTRILAACWALGHNDLHRRNLGFTHNAPDEPFGVRVAPMYDTSSAIGRRVKGTREMAVGIARQRAFHRIGPAQWLEHARAAGQDREEVLEIVSRTLAELPEALAAAREDAREEDENRIPQAVDRRTEAMLAYVAKRHEGWEAEIGRMRARGARGLKCAPDAAIERAQRIHGMRLTHPDPKVRADAAVHLAALTPRDEALASLESILRDADVRSDAALLAQIEVRKSEIAAETLGANAAVDAAYSAITEKARREARGTVKPPAELADTASGRRPVAIQRKYRRKGDGGYES